jgi:hypothetical protein
MTDFIARLAARAAGGAASARPRVPSRFEAMRGADLTVVAEEVPAPPIREPAQSPTTFTRVPSPLTPVRGYPARRHDRVETVREQTVVGRQLEADTATAGAEPTASPSPPGPLREVHSVVERAAAAAAPVAPVITRAVPVVTEPVTHQFSSASVDEPAAPDVRISIGRVEIRAAPPPPPAPRPARPPAGKPDPLPLREYLRGRRSVP